MSSYALKAGKSYNFVLRRTISVPPDDEEFYVLESEWGGRYLMPAQYYKHYGLKFGQPLTCHVDKINCSGMAYLEPEHPFCKKGDVLDFKVTGTKDIINSAGVIEKMLLVRDPWGIAAWLNITGHEALANEKLISCPVWRVKKGQLFITHAGITAPAAIEPNRELQEFTIRRIITLAENHEYYCLDMHGDTHYLRLKYYEEFKLTQAGSLLCRVKGNPGFYSNYLEPEHPHYTPGLEYWFEYINNEYETTDEGEKKRKVILKDKLDIEYSFFYDGDIPRWPSRVRAMVNDISLGKLYLDILEVE